MVLWFNSKNHNQPNLTGDDCPGNDDDDDDDDEADDGDDEL